MKLTSESKVFLGILGVTALILVGAVAWLSKTAPAVSRAELLPDGASVRGNLQAQTYLVEFSDFQCPACKAAKSLVDQIVEANKNKLVFGYRNFPLQQHPMAQPAALAAEAAARQGKFWPMYDFLFANQDKLSDEVIRQGAQLLQLDMARFQTDLNDPKLGNKIDKDVADGTRFGVDATPTFFLNGKKLELTSLNDLTNAVTASVGK